MSALRIFSAPPERLLETESEGLAKLLGGPSLIHFAGRAGKSPLAAVALLHGNETSGWTALRRVLKKRRGPLPRPLLLLLGNLRAAAAGVRFLPGGADWNRVWESPSDGAANQMAFARTALDAFRRAGVCAGVDLHNNNGRNPPYAAIFRNRRAVASAALAAGFSGLVVETKMPRGTCMEALSSLAPAATLECGVPGSPAGISLATIFLNNLLDSESPPRGAPKKTLRTVAKMKLPSRHSVVFGNAPADGDAAGGDVAIPAGAERWNFRALEAGFVFARVRPGASGFAGFPTRDENGADVFGRYFVLEKNAVRVARGFTPAMLTVNQKAARDDCLCYIMEDAEI